MPALADESPSVPRANCETPSNLFTSRIKGNPSYAAYSVTFSFQCACAAKERKRREREREKLGTGFASK